MAKLDPIGPYGPEDHPVAYFSPTEGYIATSIRRVLDSPPPLVRVSDSRVVHELPADAIRLIPVELHGQDHYYVSTYCQHGDHDECRLECKTCQAPCRCTHHEVES